MLVRGWFFEACTVGGPSVEMPKFRVSYKAQNISPQFPFLVRELLFQKVFDACPDPQLILYVLEPLGIKELMNRRVMDLVEGQLHRIALCLCLGRSQEISQLVTK